ncbi:MAG: sulfite exporter TauE/SafE family protein [Saprospiraceae bacterium]|nr:sulfite exporter TauE/SafE family protein [Saprospiraceae bacterium]
MGIEILLISIVCFVGSLLTFFSGFGLGTLLLPVFNLFFPIHLAIGMTAIVHFLNNAFKLGLMTKYIDWKMVRLFGFPAMLGAFIGAIALKQITIQNQEIHFALLNMDFTNSLIKICIGSLLIVFSILELFQKSIKPITSSYWIIPGGLMSGFFGGLSGHQGALRSIFLIRTSISKEAYIGTGIMIACLVDISRISQYIQHIRNVDLNFYYILIPCLAAFLGAWLGQKFLHKTTFPLLKYLVAFFLILFGLLLLLGII